MPETKEQTEMVEARVRPGRSYNDETKVPHRNYAAGETVTVTREVFDMSHNLVAIGSADERRLAGLYRERGESAIGLDIDAAVKAEELAQAEAATPKKRGPGRPRKTRPENDED